MNQYPESIQRAITALSQLPGIGTKTAERLVLFFMRKSKAQRTELIDALAQVNTRVFMCSDCGYITDNPNIVCRFCSDTTRKKSIICVVSDIPTVQTIEKSGAYKGLYHILGGTINPIEGVTADMLRINALEQRIAKKNGSVQEVILATGTDIEGEQTALYITQKLKNLPITISRLARGIPRGSNLEYTDEMTLADAIKDRRKI